MSWHRRHRRDGNHSDVVRDLRKVGFDVCDTSQVGGGFPDLVVGAPGNRVQLVELKDKNGKLSAAQELFIVEHRFLLPIIARSAEDVIDYFRRKAL